MTRTIGGSKWKGNPVLENFEGCMRALHPRTDPQDHLDVLKTIGDLTLSGSTTTVSEVVEEIKTKGFTLSKWQIRSRIKSLQKECYITMEYEPGRPKLFFVHEVKGSIGWKQLMELLRELRTHLGRNSAEMKALERMRTSGDFLGFIRVYNSIARKIGLHIVEIRGLAKRIELTHDGWNVYYA